MKFLLLHILVPSSKNPYIQGQMFRLELESVLNVLLTSQDVHLEED